MLFKEPFTDLKIHRAPSGFYQGYSLPIALVSKCAIIILVLWALFLPSQADKTLNDVNWALLGSFNTFYVVSVGAFACFMFILAAIPGTGKILMGRAGEAPEFSTFSWFSMMFGAGLGVGLMVYATAEPMGLWNSNPEILAGEVEAGKAEAVTSAFRYTFLHYGFHAWAIYVTTGLALAYYAYTRNMPLTIRTALTPLLGKWLNGPIGHLVDILGVIATILGVSVTIGFGVSQFVDGLYAITGMGWLVKSVEKPEPSTVGLLVSLSVIMGMSILSAVSGVGRGVKYLSNLNLVLSVTLLLIFVIFGSFAFAMTTYGSALVDYLIYFIPLSFHAYPPETQTAFVAILPEAVKALPAADLSTIFTQAINPWGSLSGFKEAMPASFNALPGSEELAASVFASGQEGRLFGWQSQWQTFYWAWWIAFSPFVGLFLARISRGRTVREFILGCVIAPALVCFAWMTILGGTAIDSELTGSANGAIINASTTAKLFVTLGQIISGNFLSAVTVMCVVLILTFLVTSADSGILVINTIMSGGDQETGVKHRIIWGVLLTAVIGTLLVAGGGGLKALKNAMIIGALPFAMVMVLMCVSLAKALYKDFHRTKHAEKMMEAAE